MSIIDFCSLIAEEIEAFEVNSISLSAMVARMDSYIGELEASGFSNAEALRESWRALEEVNAVTLDEDRREPQSIHQHIVDEAISNIKYVLQRRP